MIAAKQDINNCAALKLDVSKSNEILLIINVMKEAIPNFLIQINTRLYENTLNEDQLTQIYQQQVQILVRKHNYPFNISSQYRNITYQSQGISDLYFYPNEELELSTSIFSAESKRLPAPDKRREKEHVIGNKNNGGIERYKTEKHGKGLSERGLLSFVEEETFPFWQQRINTWISGLLIRIPDIWKADENLAKIESGYYFIILQSIAHRVSKKDIRLHYLWINIQ